MFLRRLVPVFAIVFCGSLALAAAAMAAGGGMSPGKYSFTNHSADAFFGMGSKGGPPAPSWSVTVNQGLNSFRPKHPNGPAIVDDSTVVYVTEFDALGNGGYGCFVVPDSSFTVSRDFKTAALHATLTSDEIFDGYAGPVGGGKDIVLAGGEGGLDLPIRVDVTWSATSAVSTNKDVFSFRCLNASTDGNSTYQSVMASAWGTISALDGSFTSEFSDGSAGSTQLNVHDVPPDACFA